MTFLEDVEKIPPNLPEIDFKIALANCHVREWMRDEENRTWLSEKKAEYLHRRGYSHSKRLKAEFDIPYDAFCALPPSVKNFPKELAKWVERYHPYLLFRSVT